MTTVDHIVKAVHQNLQISEDRVALVVENSTPLPISVASWPVKNKDDEDFSLAVYRGDNFDDQVLAGGTTFVDKEYIIGSIKKSHHYSLSEHYGWIFFDLVRPDRYRIHLQLFIHLKHKGIDRVLLGKLDLDSSFDDPMPSGELGQVVFDKDADVDQVKFVITDDIKNVTNVDITAAKKASKLFPGKGIETSSYVSQQFSVISLIVGVSGRYHEYAEPSHPRPYQIEHSVHEIEGLRSKAIEVFVEHDNKVFFKGSVRVNPITGEAKGPGFASTLDTPAKFSDDGFTLNYGFYDAGEGRHDQLYVYVTPSHSSWIGDLIKSDPHWLKVPFSKLVLPAAHDSGMFQPLDPGLLALITSGKLSDALANKAIIDVGTPVVHWVIKALEELKLQPQRVINNIANTQKDPFPNQLKIGVRFFDFRPGYCFHDVINMQKGRIHHQHAMVPGCEYVTFLTNVLEFLSTHPSEIVVAQIKASGFLLPKQKLNKEGEVVALSMVPTAAELAASLAEAHKAVPKADIVIGSPKDLDLPIGTLIQSKKRFIMIDLMHDPDGWDFEDTYDHKAYNTRDPAPIIACLEQAYLASFEPPPPDPSKPLRGCIYQLQATPTANIEADLGASLTYSDCSSLLVGMKSVMDRETYKWIMGKKFQEAGNVVLLNDFVDGVLIELAIDKSKERASELLAAKK